MGRYLSITLGVLLIGAIAGCDNSAREEARAAAARAAEQEAVRDLAEREAARAKLEEQRLADLWSYMSVPVGAREQLTAAINSANGVDTDGGGEHRVRLVFRDHPSWGRSSYLVLEAGDFDCGNRCTVSVIVDDAAPTPMAARRPQTDEAIAMFINDAATLWQLTDGATRITIEFPVQAGGMRRASFDVSGLDRSKMPGWK